MNKLLWKAEHQLALIGLIYALENEIEVEQCPLCRSVNYDCYSCSWFIMYCTAVNYCDNCDNTRENNCIYINPCARWAADTGLFDKMSTSRKKIDREYLTLRIPMLRGWIERWENDYRELKEKEDEEI